MDRKVPDPKSMRLDHHHRPLVQTLLRRFDRCQDRRRSLLGATPGPAQENDTRLGLLSEGEEIAEVGVGSHNDAALLGRYPEDLSVEGTRQSQIVHMHRVVSGLDQEFGHPTLERLVDQEPHAGSRSGSVP